MRTVNPQVNYSISKDTSQQIQVYRLILSVMVIFIHSYWAVSPFSSESVNVETVEWLTSTKYVISQIITRSAVPGFFLISSILLYKRPYVWKENLLRKLKSLGIPFLILNLGWIMLFFVLQQFSFTASLFGNPDNFIASWTASQWVDAIFGFKNDLVPFLYPMWFLRDLLILNLFSALIWKLVDKLPYPMLLLTLFAWFKYADSNISVPDVQGVCFWIIGAFMVKKNIRLEFLNRPPLLLFTAAYILLVWYDKSNAYMYRYTQIHNLCQMFGVFCLFAMCRPFRNSSVLLKLSAYSFSIYLFHEFTTLTFRKIAAMLFPASPVSQLFQYLLIPFVVTLFCIVLSMVLKKLLPRFYTLLTGGR